MMFQIDTEELSVENAISKALDKIVKLQLEPVWHQLGPKTKNLVQSLSILRNILMCVLRLSSSITITILILSQFSVFLGP